MSDTVLPQDVFVGQDFYAPGLRVVVGGKELRQIETDVVSVSYTDKNNEIDSVELTVNNWDPDGLGPGRGWWKYSDANTLDPWQDVEIRMGYYRAGNDELRRMMVGELVRLTPSFTAGGPATLTVRGLGMLNRFRTSQISKDYFQKKDSASSATSFKPSRNRPARASPISTSSWTTTKSAAPWRTRTRSST